MSYGYNGDNGDTTYFVKPSHRPSPISVKGSEIENAKKEKKKQIITKMSIELKKIEKERNKMAEEDKISRVLQTETLNESKENKDMRVAVIESTSVNGDTKKQIIECQEIMKFDKESSEQNELCIIITKQNEELEKMKAEDELSKRKMQFDTIQRILINRKQTKDTYDIKTESKDQSTNHESVKDTSHEYLYELETGYPTTLLDNTELESYLKLVDFLENESINCLQIYQREYEKSSQYITILDKFEDPITDDFESKLIHGVDEYYIYSIYYELIEEVAYSNHRLVLAKYNKYKILFFKIQQYALTEIHNFTDNDIQHVFNVIYAFYYFLYYDKFEKTQLLPLAYYDKFEKPKLLPLLKSKMILKSCYENLETYLNTERGGKGRKSRRKSHRKTNYRKTRSYRF